MIQTSAAWKAAIFDPDVARICKARVTISLGPSLCSTPVQINTSSTAEDPSACAMLLNGYAVGSLNWYASTELSNSSRTFSDTPRIQFTYPEPLSVEEVRLSFDRVDYTNAEEFYIDFWDANSNSLGSWFFASNSYITHTFKASEATTSTTSDLTAVSIIRIRMTKWSTANHAACISMFAPQGAEIVNEDDRIISIETEEENDTAEIDLGSLTAGKLTLALDNADRRYSPDNPESPFYGISLKNKAVLIEYGMQYENQTIEYIPGGLFYIDSISADYGDAQAVITGYDIMRQFTECEPVDLTGTSGHGHLDWAYKKVMAKLINAPYVEWIHAEDGLALHLYAFDEERFEELKAEDVLKQIGAAALSGFHQTRGGYIRFQELTCPNSDLPEAQQPLYHYYVPDLFTPIITQDAWFFPLHDDTGKNTWLNSSFIKQNRNNVYKREYSASVNENGQNRITILDNPFILNGYPQSQADAEKKMTAKNLAIDVLKKYYYDTLIKEFDYRCDPAIEAGDLIRLYIDDNTCLDARVLRHVIRYNGAFSGSMTVRGRLRTINT